jgi:hypothetical protein
MDQGLSDDEVRTRLGDLVEIPKIRRQWEGEAHRSRAHAKAAAIPPLPKNSIDGAELLDEVLAFLRRFVAHPSIEELVAHTLWIAHTHAMDVWDSTPRLAFLSPEPGSGKTRALETSELLVPNPVEAINVTPAYLFRKVAPPDGRPTILFDEADTVFGPKAGDHERSGGCSMPATERELLPADAWLEARRYSQRKSRRTAP